MRKSGKLSSHVRHNLVGYVAVFIALSGTAYAARPMITGADIENGSITDTDINAANKDGTAATPSLRTLGTGARQAMPGNATPGGPPSGSAGGDLTGTYPNPAIATGAVGTNEVDGSLTGANVSDSGGGTLTGDDVLESSLGKVGDAETLDGKDSTAFMPADAGVQGWEHNSITEPISPRSLESVPVDCSSGKRPVGAGYDIPEPFGAPSDVEIRSSLPKVIGFGWVFQVLNLSNDFRTVTLDVICVKG